MWRRLPGLKQLARGVAEVEELAGALRDFEASKKMTRAISLLYPGVRAIALHRVAHALRRRRLQFLPWALAELNRCTTGIEISPGATIGRRVVIVHGTGTVIGDTAVVGDDVVLLHGVTLGARDVRHPPPGKRHPTIEAGATICAGAVILGDITVGRGATVGANAVVLEPVPAEAIAVGAPARTLRTRKAGRPERRVKEGRR